MRRCRCVIACFYELPVHMSRRYARIDAPTISDNDKMIKRASRSLCFRRGTGSIGPLSNRYRVDGDYGILLNNHS